MQPIFFENIIPLDHCIELENAFFKFIKDGNENTPDEVKYMNNSMAVFAPYKTIPELKHVFEKHNTPESLFNRLTNEIKKNFNDRIEFRNSYLRIYYNDSDLPIHVDRKMLDITLSVHVGGLESWPLHISNIKRYEGGVIENAEEYKKDSKPFYIPRGSGVACYGKYPHWRDKLVCNQNEYVMQIFYHWTII